MKNTKLSIGILITILVFGVTIMNVFGFFGFGNTLTWQEEVKLLDGRVITVKQKRRIDGSNMEREAWLTFKLSEFSNKEIVWHENLCPKILNVYQNKLYVVGIPATIIEYRQYGRPEPYYIGYRFDNAQWVRIPFNEIPVAIYDANMYPDNMAIARLKRVSISDKTEIFKDDRWMPDQRRIVPNYKSRLSDPY